ncbi:MAG: 4a-hydroxytetrahydrobiopterin dehydratase [Dermatophilaceae bacterium]
MNTLTGAQFTDEGLTGWSFLADGIQTRLRTGDFASGMALLCRIGEAAEEMNHHPDLDLRYTYLDVRLTSHDAGGVTSRDVMLARRIGELAADAEVGLDPGV